MSKLFIIIAVLILIGGVGYYVQKNVSLKDAVEEDRTGRKYFYRSIDECGRVFFTCEEGYRHFADDTGCGCEKDDSMRNIQKEENTMMEKDIMMESPSGVVIRYTNDGYEPSSLTIKKGMTVTFKNGSPRDTWPASAQHPTHRAYPGSDIGKCGTSQERGIFDACRAIPPGSEWSFRFDHAGKWFYHNHLMPNKFGSITVEE